MMGGSGAHHASRENTNRRAALLRAQLVPKGHLPSLERQDPQFAAHVHEARISKTVKMARSVSTQRLTQRLTLASPSFLDFLVWPSRSAPVVPVAKSKNEGLLLKAKTKAQAKNSKRQDGAQKCGGKSLQHGMHDRRSATGEQKKGKHDQSKRRNWRQGKRHERQCSHRVRHLAQDL